MPTEKGVGSARWAMGMDRVSRDRPHPGGHLRITSARDGGALAVTGQGERTRLRSRSPGHIDRRDTRLRLRAHVPCVYGKLRGRGLHVEMNGRQAAPHRPGPQGLGAGRA